MCLCFFGHEDRRRRYRGSIIWQNPERNLGSEVPFGLNSDGTTKLDKRRESKFCHNGAMIS
jgi:hypothetical protein